MPTRVPLSVTMPAHSTSLATPTPDAPHPLPPAREFVDQYTVQAGDTLGSIAQRYGITLEALMQANGLNEASVLSIGVVLNIPPVVTDPNPGSSFKIIPDSELVYGPASATFDVDSFVQGKGGYLADYVQDVNGEYLSGSQVVMRVAQNYSVNPRLLLALLEYRFLRLGNRANESYAEMTATVFLPDGPVLFDFQRPAITDNRAFDAGGMRFEVIEPAERLRTSYVGNVLELADPSVMADPKKAFAESPRRHLTLDLVHSAVGPMYGSAHDEHEASESHENQFAKAHYEQHMHVTGALDLEGQVIEIDGYGLRDHSWGPRYWQAIHSYEWLTMNFGPDSSWRRAIRRRARRLAATSIATRSSSPTATTRLRSCAGASCRRTARSA